MTRAYLPPILLALLSACDEGSPASPTYEVAEASSYAVCPTGMQPTFDSIYTLMLSAGSTQLDGQQSCGANVANNCHSTSGSSVMGNGCLLDFSLDESLVYAELLKPSTNIGDTSNPTAGFHPLRVAPGDAGASMLYVKITLDTSSDPNYGSGMPYTDPGSVCPEAVAAVREWIDQGAPGPPGGDAGAGSDASDASSDAHDHKDAHEDGPSDATADGTTDATLD